MHFWESADRKEIPNPHTQVWFFEIFANIIFLRVLRALGAPLEAGPREFFEIFDKKNAWREIFELLKNISRLVV